MLLEVVLFLLTGLATGLLSGLLGIGGGSIVVPMLALIFQLNNFPAASIMHLAAGSSLAVMVFTSQATARSHCAKTTVHWDIYWRLLPGVVLGTIAGVVFASHLKSVYLSMIFGIFLLTISIKMFFSQKHVAAKQMPNSFIMTLAGSAIGGKSGLLGIGGGALTVPFLTRYNVPLRETAAISALCSMCVACIGSISAIIVGTQQYALPKWSTGFVYWPAVLCIAATSMLAAPLGTALAYKLPVEILRKVFAGFLLMVALHMLFQ